MNRNHKAGATTCIGSQLGTPAHVVFTRRYRPQIFVHRHRMGRRETGCLSFGSSRMAGKHCGHFWVKRFGTKPFCAVLWSRCAPLTVRCWLPNERKCPVRLSMDCRSRLLYKVSGGQSYARGSRRIPRMVWDVSLAHRPHSMGSSCGAMNGKRTQKPYTCDRNHPPTRSTHT